MTEKQNRATVGLLLVFSHLGIITLIFILYLLGGFLFEEMTTSIALIAPMFSLYTTAIVRHLVRRRRRRKDESQVLTREYVIITLSIPGIFVLFLFAIVILNAFHVGLTSFEDFKIMLAVGQAAFGVYVGLVLSPMFGHGMA